MRCEKCKYITKTTCKCHFGYEQASKEFVDGNCEKFIDKYKEEYTPIIAREIFAEIEGFINSEIGTIKSINLQEQEAHNNGVRLTKIELGKLVVKLEKQFIGEVTK